MSEKKDDIFMWNWDLFSFGIFCFADFTCLVKKLFHFRPISSVFSDIKNNYFFDFSHLVPILWLITMETVDLLQGYQMIMLGNVIIV